MKDSFFTFTSVEFGGLELRWPLRLKIMITQLSTMLELKIKLSLAIVETRLATFF